MTRDQIKECIQEILAKHQRIKFNNGNPIIVYTDEALEEIMKLWDKGFTYDLPKNDSLWDRGVQGQVDADHVWRDEWGNAR